MVKRKTKRPTNRDRLLQSLDHWTRERAQAIADGDKTAQAIAERNRENALKELERIRTR